MLYDAQTINEVVVFVDRLVVEQAAAAAAYGLSSSDDDEEDAGTSRRHRLAAGSAAQQQERAEEADGDLLKPLHAPPAQRPLFLIAPGIANAQAAYFAFGKMLRCESPACQ